MSSRKALTVPISTSILRFDLGDLPGRRRTKLEPRLCKIDSIHGGRWRRSLRRICSRHTKPGDDSRDSRMQATGFDGRSVRVPWGYTGASAPVPPAGTCPLAGQVERSAHRSNPSSVGVSMSVEIALASSLSLRLWLRA